jgi:hypothetical protein
MTIDELTKTVGRAYRKYDEQGLAEGCMAPVYLLYPGLPRFEWPEDDRLGKFMVEMFELYGQKIAKENIKVGDLVLIRLPFGLVHPAVYVGNDEIIDCMVETSMQKSRFSFIRRVEGVFRCHQ